MAPCGHGMKLVKTNEALLENKERRIMDMEAGSS